MNKLISIQNNNNNVKIIVIAKPSAREEKIEKISPTAYKISVKEPARNGRANWAIERILGEYFKISPLRIKIISGFRSRLKTVQIEK